MAVNDETAHLVSLVPLRFGLIEVCAAGVGQPCGSAPGLHGRGSGRGQCAAFSLLEKTSLSWRPSRLPPLPRGHAERQEDEAVTGGRRARDGRGGSLWRRWRTTAFLSPIVCREAGLEQSWLTVVENRREIRASWNKLWQGLPLLSMVSAASGLVLVPSEKLEGREGHLPCALWRCLLQLSCCGDCG